MENLPEGVLTIKSSISLDSLFNSLTNHTSVQVSYTDGKNEKSGYLRIRFDSTSVYNRGTWTGFITIFSHGNVKRKCTLDTSGTVCGFIFEK